MRPAASELTIPLRPNTNAVGFASLLAFIIAFGWGMFFLAHFAPGPPLTAWEKWAAVLVSVAVLTPALACVFYRLHARLALTEAGLRWRTWGEWRQVSWDAVTDYYDLPYDPKDGEGKLMRIETSLGAVLADRRWPESAEARQWIEARATAADALGWGVLGDRTTKTGTRIFTYPQKEFWNTLAVWLVILPVYIASIWLLLANGSRSNSPAAAQLSSAFWAPGEFWIDLVIAVFLGLLTAGGVVIFSLPLLVFVSMVPQLIDVRRRRSERITTRPGGLTFSNRRREFTARWDEVTGYFLQPSEASRHRVFRATARSSSKTELWRWTFAVETTQGSFEFSALLDDCDQFQSLLKQHGLTLEARKLPAPQV